MTQAIKRLKATKQTEQVAAVTLPKDVQSFVADYDDTEGLAEEFTKALKKFGIVVQQYNSESDSLCFTLSKTKLSKAQLKSLFGDDD